MSPTPAIMIQGTGSHVGKSVRVGATLWFLPRETGEGDHAQHGGGGAVHVARRNNAPSVGFADTSPAIAGEEPNAPARGVLCRGIGP
jgi:hypothetical protein